MLRLRITVLLLLGFGLLAVAAQAQKPSFSITGDGMLVVSDLPAVLSRPEVKPHLSTGLTTSFVLQVTAVDETGRKLKGAGRVDIRYEPWDEIFLTRRLGADRRGQKETVASFDRLVAWWKDLQIPVLATGGRSPGASWEVRVEVEVIPFSQSEQRETQRWFSDSIGQSVSPPKAGEGESQIGQTGDPGLSGVLDLLVATSIKRRSLVGYSWKASYRPAEDRK